MNESKSGETGPCISVHALYATLGLPSSPAIIDVRPNLNDGARLIPGALWVSSIDDAQSWVASFASDRTIAVCCEDGDECSRRYADVLAGRGFRSVRLTGGVRAWEAAGFGTVRVRADLQFGASRWVTRERPKIDRLACPWLVRRFIDPGAQFFYVPAHDVRSQAEILAAQPYDIADVTFSHRGRKCSFDAFLSEFDLHDPSLDRVADIVRAADTGQPELSPQAQGLLAISLGLSANIPDDVLLLEYAMPIYDALYAWSKSARMESHSWPQKSS